MAFLVSPGVEVKEIDLTGIIPAVSTSIGGYAGHFEWGPVGELVNLSTEEQLASTFGIPTKARSASYHTASTFLRYGNTLLVSRAIDEDTALNASEGDAALYKNKEAFEDATPADKFYARCPGTLGNSLQVLVHPAGNPTRLNVTQIETIDAYQAGTSLNDGDVHIMITVNDTDAAFLTDQAEIMLRRLNSKKDWVNRLEGKKLYVGSGNQVGDDWTYVLYTESTISGDTAYDATTGYKDNEAGIPSTSNLESEVLTSVTDGFLFSPPEAELFEDTFVNDPGTSAFAEALGVSNDEVNILVVDKDGKFSEGPGTVIERYGNLSVGSDARAEDGGSIFYKDVINTSSNYIFVEDLDQIKADVVLRDQTSGTTLGDDISTSISVDTLTGGADGTDNNGNIYDALDLFKDAETLDVNLLFAENDTEGTVTVANRIITICEDRKDCVGFISPDIEVKDQASDSAKLDKVLDKMDRLASTSYAVLDSTPLYVYDKYNDEYIWVPASGTMAGLCARTDDLRDPWFSPAGFTRGQILGVAQLAFNPQQSHRDELYKSRVNPIVSFPGEGIVLFGDKTAQSKPSAFDRINVRRLFITIEKAISTSAKFSLFEFNDEFTRAQFRNLIEPYLRDVQGRRGITDFHVVCDDTNNTGEVIDSNRFVADIYIKPARAINFITLNFIATRTGVEFNEVIGQF